MILKLTARGGKPIRVWMGPGMVWTAGADEGGSYTCIENGLITIYVLETFDQIGSQIKSRQYFKEPYEVGPEN
jgi:hypothetical protein